MRYKPPKIEDVSLPTYLDQTKTKHNGLGYQVWRTLFEAGVNPMNLARAMNVTRNTVVNWIKLDRQHRKERADMLDKLEKL